jgi:hypothetical protein
MGSGCRVKIEIARCGWEIGSDIWSKEIIAPKSSLYVGDTTSLASFFS